MTEKEKAELKLVFGDQLNLSKIRINESSFWLKVTRQKGMAYVWIKTIHFSRVIYCDSKLQDMAWLVHEVTHIAQFNKLGIQYVFDALIAQIIGGYDYGGKENLTGNKLNYFNLEQQADIARNYYLDLKRGKELENYKIVIADLKRERF